MKYQSPWELDPSLDERLIAWRAQGIEFSTIAHRLGMTRNACIGRARRQGLANPTVSAPRDPKPEPPPEPEPEPMPEQIYTGPIRLIDTLNALRECRWPIDGGREPMEPMCCGAPTVEGTSWCSEHLRKVFAPQPKRRDAA